MTLSCTRGTEEGAGRRREQCGDLGLTSDEILGQGNIETIDLYVSFHLAARPLRLGICKLSQPSWEWQSENPNPDDGLR
jgi:hypothetical protein